MGKLMCLEIKEGWDIKSGKSCVKSSVKEVTVEKETPKQYTISGGFYRSKLNKSELLLDLGYSDSPQVFCLEQDINKAFDVAKSSLKREIEDYKEKLNKRELLLIELKKLEEQYA